jgi:hypothetical protein
MLAASSTSSCLVGIEAKTSGQSLRHRHRPKINWVISLRADTGDELAGVFATWTLEQTFRDQLQQTVGQAAGSAVIIGHEAITRLPNRLAAIVASMS